MLWATLAQSVGICDGMPPNAHSIIYFLFAEFELPIFHNNIVKILDKLNKRNLLKICFQVTYPSDFCIICIHFYYGEKVKIFDFWKTKD